METLISQILSYNQNSYRCSGDLRTVDPCTENTCTYHLSLANEKTVPKNPNPSTEKCMGEKTPVENYIRFLQELRLNP